MSTSTAEAPAEAPAATRRHRLLVLGATLAVVVGVALRVRTGSALWLDEALSVNIARLPLGEIPEALRHDGAPPLYYLLLHGWIRLFGDGDLAARSLSGVLSVAALPPAYLAGRREAGRFGGIAALLLIASSPFAIHYATEARMYALVVLLVLLGHVALRAALDRPTVPRLAAVALVAGLLALTHYWALFLLATVGLLLLRLRRWRVAAGLVAGGLVFAPWLPSFLYQAAHTGTPWSRPAGFGAVWNAIGEWAGGSASAAAVVMAGFLGLAALGWGGRPVDDHTVAVDLRGRAPGPALAAASVGTVLVGILAGQLAGSGYAARYTAVALAPFVILVAVGLTRLPGSKLPYVVLAVVTAAGLVRSLPKPFDATKTQAAVIAAAIEPNLTPGAVVAYCPDQLGPAVSHYLPASAEQVTFPSFGRPERVDWVDYERRNESASAADFARRLLDRPGDVWLVWSPNYRTFDTKCEQLVSLLSASRHATEVVASKSRYFERATVYRFSPR